jgi:hypothetical protein
VPGPLSIDEVDLLSFFEVEPTHLEAGMPWLYNDSIYEISDGQLRLSFGITPLSKDVSIAMKLGEAVVYELRACYVEDVRCRKEKDRESLEIVISRSESIWLNIKPTISIWQSCRSHP